MTNFKLFGQAPPQGPQIFYRPGKGDFLSWYKFNGVNANLIQIPNLIYFNLTFGTKTDTSQQRLLDWPLHMLAICPNRIGRRFFCWFA